MAVAITLLGHPRVVRDGEVVAFETRKAMALLAQIALAEHPRPREAVCELLYPGHPPDKARGALRRTLSALRSGLGEEWIDAAGDGIALRRGEGLQLDVDRFHVLCADGADCESLAQGVALFGGDFLEGFSLRDSPDFDDWQVSVARSLEQELAAAMRRLVEGLVARGDFEQALPHARRWLELAPLHEAAHRELMRLYAWSGDRAAALEQYRTCVRTLNQELGVGPLEETTNLYMQIGDGELAPPQRRAQATPAAVRSAAAAAPPAVPELPLVGRDDELAQLTGAYGAATARGAFIVLEGEAGIGRSRLAGELATHARAEGGRVLGTRCYDDESGIAYGPVLHLLRQAAGAEGLAEAVAPQRIADAALLLPELAVLRADLPAALSLEGPGAQVRLLEAVTAVIAAACAGPAPGLVFVDDLHAADDATLDVVTYLARRLGEQGLVLLVTWRSEAVPPGHRLRRLSVDLARSGVVATITPGRLQQDDVAELVRAVRPDAGTGRLAERVHRESEGLPLFAAEYLAALGDRGGDGDTDDVVAWDARGLLDGRIDKLGGAARQLLDAAAVIGRAFAHDTLRRAGGRSDDETVGAIEELVAAGLLVENAGDEPGFAFSHEKLRALVYEQTGLARRCLLHGRVADALSQQRPDGAVAAVVAQHLEQAGDRAGAALQHQVAAEHAAALYAHADALVHLESALALGHPDAAVINERIADLLTLRGDYSAAIARYESAAALCGAERLAGIECKLGGVHHRRGQYAAAQSHLLAALDAAAPEDRALRARVNADLALALHQSGEDERALAIAGDALVLAQAAADRRAEAQVHNILGVLGRDAAELEASLDLAIQLDDPAAQATALNNLALLRRDAGDLPGALALTERALALCAHHGDRHREAALQNNLADLYHAAGSEEESMRHLKAAVAIFSQIGGDQATRQPEIWKLVSW